MMYEALLLIPGSNMEIEKVAGILQSTILVRGFKGQKLGHRYRSIICRVPSKEWLKENHTSMAQIRELVRDYWSLGLDSDSLEKVVWI
jgi:hypothetical protein